LDEGLVGASGEGGASGFRRGLRRRLEPAVLAPLKVTAPKPWFMMVAEPALITRPAPLNVSAPGPTTKV
jgi:hypothetical protein